jgi:hypothetical protein
MSRWWLAVPVVAVVVRQLIIWSGYSWIVGTSVAVVLMLGFIVLMDRRSAKR